MIDKNYKIDIRHRKVLAAIEDYKTFLEVGPGNGKCSLYLLEKAKDVEMIDYDISSVSFIKNICKDKKLKFIFYLCDILTFKPTRKYDIVFACQVIEHIKDWKNAILKMLSLASKGVVLSTPVENGFTDPDHKHSFKESDFDWLKKKFKDKFFIYKTITREKDLSNVRKRCFIIEIYK